MFSKKFRHERCKGTAKVPIINLSIKVFGSTKTNLEKLYDVQLKIQSCSSSNFEILEAIVAPTICSPLSGQFIELAKNQYTHLNNIQLSDCNVNNSNSQIGVLIGADHYGDFMTGEVKRGSKGPVAIKTILGWVLNGTFKSCKALVKHPLNFAVHMS